MHHHFDLLYPIPNYYVAIVLMVCCASDTQGFPYFVRMRVCCRVGQGVLFLELVHCDINRTGHKI